MLVIGMSIFILSPFFAARQQNLVTLQRGAETFASGRRCPFSWNFVMDVVENRV